MSQCGWAKLTEAAHGISDIDILIISPCHHWSLRVASEEYSRPWNTQPYFHFRADREQFKVLLHMLINIRHAFAFAVIANRIA